MDEINFLGFLLVFALTAYIMLTLLSIQLKSSYIRNASWFAGLSVIYTLVLYGVQSIMETTVWYNQCFWALGATFVIIAIMFAAILLLRKLEIWIKKSY